MEKKLYVGNLVYSMTSDDLKSLFTPFGTVTSANVIEGKGFGFVEMSTAEEAEKAKTALNGQDCKGRTLKIDSARPKQPKSYAMQR